MVFNKNIDDEYESVIKIKGFKPNSYDQLKLVLMFHNLNYYLIQTIYINKKNETFFYKIYNSF